MKSTISFIVDQNFAALLQHTANAESISKSLLIRSVLFNWISTNHRSLVEEIYE